MEQQMTVKNHRTMNMNKPQKRYAKWHKTFCKRQNYTLQKLNACLQRELTLEA